MKQPPRPFNEALLNGDRIRRILAISLYNWTVIFGVFEWARQTTGNIDLARTMAIQALVAGRIFYLLSISQLLPSIAAKLSNRTGSISSAPAIAAGIIGAVILQILFSQWSFINNIFSTAPLNLNQWLICLGAGLPMIAIAASVNRFDPPN